MAVRIVYADADKYPVRVDVTPRRVQKFLVQGLGGGHRQILRFAQNDTCGEDNVLD
jgi:hypothetical protein